VLLSLHKRVKCIRFRVDEVKRDLEEPLDGVNCVFVLRYPDDFVTGAYSNNTTRKYDDGSSTLSRKKVV